MGAIDFTRREEFWLDFGGLAPFLRWLSRWRQKCLYILTGPWQLFVWQQHGTKGAGVTQAEDRVAHSLAHGVIVRAAALIEVPWANGGGVTRVIADQANFRLSLATIVQAGPFSPFPGMTRHFALVTGQVALQPYATVVSATSPALIFPGHDAVHAAPLAGPALALNLMVPDGAPDLHLERFAGGDLAGAVAVFACNAITVDGMHLAPHDTLFPTGPVHLTGPALVVR